MTSTMQNKTFHFILHRILPIIFWLAVWEIVAFLYAKPYFLPGFFETVRALIRIIGTDGFFKIVFLTLIRIFIGIILGTATGIILAVISHKISLVHSLISPINSIIKATPVASIIILLWVSMNGNTLAIFISFMMVFPIIWQNIYDGFGAIDKELIEVSRVFEFCFKKRMKYLVLPSLKKYFLPAFITSIGLAFKAEIAAEIIAGVRNSIGQMIYYAKDAPATDEMFAWTIVGIFFSMVVEGLAKLILTPKSKSKAEVTL